MSSGLPMCGRVRFTATKYQDSEVSQIVTMHFAKNMHSAEVNAYFNTRDNSAQLCVRRCALLPPLCELLWGMNLATTVMVWFIALHPQHNLALRSDGPISRQIAQHPTVTRNARHFPRIINERHYVWLNAFVSVLRNIPFKRRKIVYA